ncbi:MAG: hypothetical protein GY756_27810 [bacterium]|nr:hypothetical protein [bacterium]
MLTEKFINNFQEFVIPIDIINLIDEFIYQRYNKNDVDCCGFLYWFVKIEGQLVDSMWNYRLLIKEYERSYYLYNRTTAGVHINPYTPLQLILYGRRHNYQGFYLVDKNGEVKLYSKLVGSRHAVNLGIAYKTITGLVKQDLVYINSKFPLILKQIK